VGGGGSSGYRDEVNARLVREEAQRRLAEQEFLAEVNDYLTELLGGYNDRDAETINGRLDQLVEALGEVVENIDRLLFGGSVAKHTYVNGLSDVDALVVLRNAAGESPADLVGAFADAIRSALPASMVSEVVAGNLAVTVRYADGAEIQLLPARERNGVLSIASEDGTRWREVRPRKFAEKLTEVNEGTNGGAVPAVKLAKGVLDRLPDQQRLSGYHVEAIAVDAFRNFDGPTSRQAMLRHLLDHAASAVTRPTGDITGQSVHIDSHLGPAGSPERQAIASSIRRMVSKIDGATSIDDYKDLFGE
jgi:hypothetical protein